VAGKTAESNNRVDQWSARLGRLSRGWRVALSLAVTAVLVVLVSIIVDRLLVDSVIRGDLARSVPAWIAAATGVVLYALGWWALVGFDWNPAQPWHPGRPAVFFTAAGAAGLLLIVSLALFGLVFGYGL
jgi:protein-S-isoprenylcysteine O-methyltransferase Ste14